MNNLYFKKTEIKNFVLTFTPKNKLYFFTYKSIVESLEDILKTQLYKQKPKIIINGIDIKLIYSFLTQKSYLKHIKALTSQEAPTS